MFAGYEHAKFIDHFPFWQVDDGVVESNKQHVTVRYTHRSEAVDELKKLCRDRYTLKELQARPLPEGVDPKRLETYLGDEEFNVSEVATRLMLGRYCTCVCFKLIFVWLFWDVNAVEPV